MQLGLLVVVLNLAEAALDRIVVGLIRHVEAELHVQLSHLLFHFWRLVHREIVPKEGNRLEPVCLPKLNQVLEELLRVN